MPIDKRNISISFGQGIDTKTDPRQVMPGKLVALTNATLSENLSLNKRNGYQPISTISTAIASSTLTNQKLGIFNNQLLLFDGKTIRSVTNGQTQFIENFLAAQPSITTIQREATPIINQDVAYNTNTGNTAYSWSSSCIAPNFQQLAFAGCTGKFQILAPDGSVIASTGIFGFAKTKVFSAVNSFYWTGINYASSTLQYYQIPANGSSANFANVQTVGTGDVGGDFSVNTIQTSFNHYQHYDGAVLNTSLFIGWFQPASSAINVSRIAANGVITSRTFKADASGALGVFGDDNYVWVVYHNGATSAGFAVISTTGVNLVSGPNPWFTTDSATSTNIVSVPQVFTGLSNSLAANVYTQFINYYPPTQYSAASVTWNSLQRSDFIAKQSLNGATNASSGSSAIVVRGMGLSSKAFNYLGDDYFLSCYGGTQTSTSADRLEPTHFLVAGTKSTNNLVAKLAFQNAAGYDFQTGGQSYYLNNNYGSVGYGLPLPSVYATPSRPTEFNTPYLIKTAATELSSTSLVQPFFVSYNFGINSVGFDFNAPTLYESSPYGNNLNIAGGYLSAFDGKNLTEQNFHLYPEDVQIVGSSSMGPAANTYAYQVLYEWADSQGNILRSAPSKAYPITTSGTSAMYLLIPTLRATNKKNAKIRVFRNAPSLDPLTFHDIAPLMPLINDPTIDNVVALDTSTDTSIIGNPDLYTTGGILEDTGAPSPQWLTTYKLRLMVLDAETNSWWYSKEVIPGTPVEMTDLQTFSVSTKYGQSIAGIEMDDKFIIFTRSMDGSVGAIYYMTGNGPASNGTNNDFSIPNLITTTLTTNNPSGIVLTDDGVMFPSDKGIWLLGHNLSTQFIGAEVESYSLDTITSANIIPNTTEVRFTLNSGVCLVWDYFQKQWSVFANIDATHGIIYQSLFTYLRQNLSNAYVLQETLGRYQDITSPILMSLTTGWLSFSGFQGFQRAYRLYLIGQSQSNHLLNVSVAYDFNSSFYQTAIMRPLSNRNGTWGSDPAWGGSQFWGGYSQREQFRMNFDRQKCQAIQVSIQESLNPANISYGAGPVLEAIGIVIGGKLSYPKLSDTLSVK